MNTQSQTSSTNKKYRWVIIGLIWGASMYVSNSIIIPLLIDEHVTLAKALWGIPLWILAGFAFGYWMEQVNNKS